MIGSGNISYPVIVLLTAAFFLGIGLTIFGGISLGRLSKFRFQWIRPGQNLRNHH